MRGIFDAVQTVITFESIIALLAPRLNERSICVTNTLLHTIIIKIPIHHTFIPEEISAIKKHSVRLSKASGEKG